jgi:hypothetical protein
MKYISTGGAGDAFISFLKLKSRVELFREKPKWLHVESNDIVGGICSDLFSSNGYFSDIGLNFSFECDRDYIQHYKEQKWNDYIPVSSGHDLFCPLKGLTKVEMLNPFLNSLEPPEQKLYDICIQASGGAKNNRKWLFSPIDFAEILRKKGLKVCIVGTDMNFFDQKDVHNLIGKFSINSVFSVINQSKKFIGLSGLLNYYACAKRVPNMHLMESDEHEQRYYHQMWNSEKLKVGSFAEVWRMI